MYLKLWNTIAFCERVNFAEEAYNLVVEAYDPVHPQVQEAAGELINILIMKGDLYDGDGIDQESELVAEGAFNLANVIDLLDGDN
jgi:hypothetical protein